MDYFIKEAEIQDIPLLNAISIESKMYWGYPQEWMNNWRNALTITEPYLSKNPVYKLIGNEIAGFCGIEKKIGYYEVSHLWLKPGYIGKGLGRFLLTATLHKVVEKGSEVRVEADPNAEKFYARQGFITFDKIESYPKGRFLPLMKLVYK